MIEYLKTWLELKTDRRAVTALEYGVIAGVLAVVVVTAFTTLGGGLNTAFTNISNQLLSWAWRAGLASIGPRAA